MATERFEIVIDVRGLNQANQQFRQFGQQTKQAQRHVQEFQSTLRFLRASLVAFASVKIASSFLEFADSLTAVRNRLSQVTVTTGGVNEKQKQLFDIARRSRSALESVAILYTRMALSADNLTQSQAELLKFTELTTKATAASGATASEARNGLIQLAQGIASNRLGGDELRSVLENLTGVSLALASGLGVTRGELRKLAEQGGLTSDVIVKAILSQEEMIEKLFAKTTPTVGQAFEVLQNSVIQSLGAFDSATGALRGMAGAILFIADNMNALVSVIIFFAARMLIVAKNSHFVAMALASIRTAAAGATGGFAALSATFVATRATSGLLAASLVTLRTVVRSLFGPVGIALAIFGLMEFQGGATDAEKAIEKLAEQMDSLKKNFDITTKSVVGFNDETRKQAVTDLSKQIATLTQNLADLRSENSNSTAVLGGLDLLGISSFATQVQKMENEITKGITGALFSDVDAGAFGQAGDITRQFKEGALSATDLIEKLEEVANQASGPTRDAMLRLTVSFEGLLQPQLQAEKGLRDAAFQMKVLTGAATEADYALAGFINTAKNMSDTEILASLNKTDPLMKARTTQATENPILQSAVDRGLLPAAYGRAQMAQNDSAVERLADPGGFKVKQETEQLEAMRASTPAAKALLDIQRMGLPLMEKTTQERLKQLTAIYAQQDALQKGRREAESDASRMEKQYKKTRGALTFELASLQGITGEAAAIARAKSKIADFDSLSAGKQKEILGIALEIDRLESRRALNPIEGAKAEFQKVQDQISDLRDSGTIEGPEAANMLAAQTEQYRQALDPLKYFNDEMDRELALMGLTDRERQVEIATRSTLLDLQSKGVDIGSLENGVIHDQVKATLERNRHAEEYKDIVKDINGPLEELAEKQKLINEAMEAGAVSYEKGTRALMDLRLEALRFNTDTASGFERGSIQVLKEFTDTSQLAADTVVNGFRRAEDALVQFATTGKTAGFKEMINGINEDLIRLSVREGIMKPLAQLFFGDMAADMVGGKPDGTRSNPINVRNVDGVSSVSPTGSQGLFGGLLSSIFGGGGNPESGLDGVVTAVTQTPENVSDAFIVGNSVTSDGIVNSFASGTDDFTNGFTQAGDRFNSNLALTLAMGGGGSSSGGGMNFGALGKLLGQSDAVGGMFGGGGFGGGFSLADGGGMPSGGWDLSGLPVNNDFSSVLDSDLAGYGYASGGSFTVGSRNSAMALPGMDNRLVQFRARDGETVHVSTPGQGPGGGGGTYITMNVNTPDAESFQVNMQQIMAGMYAEMNRQNMRNN